MRKYRCSFPGCTKILDKAGYCEYHEKYRKVHKPYEKAIRYNEHLYHTKEWKYLRQQKIKETPYCERCYAVKNLQVHHKIPPKGNEYLFFDYNNLQVLCSDCHRIITAEENNAEKKF